MTDRRAKQRDWRTPLLLTLSVHMLVFTLVINHRFFDLVDGPRRGDSMILHAGFSGADPEEAEPDHDEGAAPGPESDKPEPPQASIAERMRDPEQPPPLPERAERGESSQLAQPDNRPLSERLAEMAAEIGVQSDTPQAGGGAAGLRGQGRKLEGLHRHGGSSDTENAVDMGLAWLASVQDHDGGWDSDGYMTHYMRNADTHERLGEGVGFARNDVGITALCLLAFTGAGNDDVQGKYSGHVRRARLWLLARQRVEDGGFGLSDDVYQVTFYGHAIATLALADLYILSNDQALRVPLQRAVNYLCAHQGARGGWDYTQPYPGAEGWQPSTRSDLSISGWAALALISARGAGIDVPAENLTRLVSMLREQTRADGEAYYANEGVRAMQRGMSMLAVSNLCRRLLGEPADSAVQSAQRRRMAGTLPDWTSQGEIFGSNMYYWYYGSLAMLLSRDAEGGHDRWRQWNIALKNTLLPNQDKSGPRRGSFDPAGDFWARNGGGRLYSTAICVLTLQVYYRYEPEFLRTKANELSPLWIAE